MTAVPAVFMLAMPAWALLYDMQRWLAAGNWMLVAVAAVMLLLEAWMVVEAVLLWPRVKSVMEEALPPVEPAAARVPVSS